MKLASGSCILRVVKCRKKDITIAKPYIIITEDTLDDSAEPKNKLSIRSCCAHIATCVTQQFSIDPKRMFWLEYYPESIYGINSEKVIPEQYEVVTFTWDANKAFHPSFRVLKSPVWDQVKTIHYELTLKQEAKPKL
ncbi:MAG: hypothetical protein OMM_09144 [Candidatus Magnetoglobus multicellularis str. Araruama]|uniref:Uncharacterized protein n=1 Tax=Candidatus Magnetoglobus multicellularis str. Araruama TaxID=890399 RepID=A0A1V1P5G8_9BACT|nr:MAG: hypothetical protein OMM_09144 [Candidatus Magnetoglobus multicellularis str. Araruama]